MWQGFVEAIFVAPQAGAPMQQLTQVQAKAGQGLEGDRYFSKSGTFSSKAGPDREVTLIEAEALEQFSQHYQVVLEPFETRRNLLTRQVPLNDLVGQVFQVGTVQLKGIQLCEPCDYLQKKIDKPVLNGLLHRGGLRAQILTDGAIQVQDVVKPL